LKNNRRGGDAVALPLNRKSKIQNRQSKILLMVIGVVKARLHFPEARSLKDKRSVLQSLKRRALNRMNVSVAEVGQQDLWQSAELAFVTVAAEHSHVQERVSAISSFLQGDPRYVLVNLETEIL
jgi:uncharacterized protein YlxP (DUF503 family)